MPYLLSSPSLHIPAPLLQIEASLEKRGATKADKEVAGAFLRQFDPSLIRAIWLDNRGKVARGTKLMVTTLDSGFHSEVISQGRLVDKTMTDFGECPSAAVGRAVFDAVMEGDRVKGLGESVASGVVTIASVGKGKKAATAAAKRALEERLPEVCRRCMARRRPQWLTDGRRPVADARLCYPPCTGCCLPADVTVSAVVGLDVVWRYARP